VVDVAISATRTPAARWVSVMLMPIRHFVVLAANHGMSRQPPIGSTSPNIRRAIEFIVHYEPARFDLLRV
jgi:hypothetical protein